jgi:hypothetical protein
MIEFNQPLIENIVKFMMVAFVLNIYEFSLPLLRMQYNITIIWNVFLFYLL